MIYDCFSFFNELDILELRLKTLYQYVDYFVIAESDYTHTGEKKPLHYKINESRFAAYSDKIIYVQSPSPTRPWLAKDDLACRWTLENVQRNATVLAIANRLNDDDILIISDLDEIPNPTAISKAQEYNCAVRLRQKMYYYFLNYRCCTTPYWLRGSVILKYKQFKDTQTYKKIEQGIAISSIVNTAPTATKVRFLKNLPVIKNGGWHFSYIGGIDYILKKLQSIADGSEAQSINSQYIEKCIKSGNDPFNRGEWYFAEPTNDSFPTAIHDYPNLIFNITPDYIRRIRIKRVCARIKGLLRPLAWKLLPNSFALKLSRFINTALNDIR